MEANPLFQAARTIETRWAAQVKAEDAPVIGIVGATDGWIRDDFVYLDEVAAGIIEGGGRPVLLSPSLEGSPLEQMTQVDGTVVVGGDDVDPALYGQTPLNPEKAYDTRLDRFELTCVRTAFEAAMPMLGLCRGLQLMNVAAGGTLVQSIAHQLGIPEADHWNDESAKNRPLRSRADHSVVVAPNSRVEEVLGPVSRSVNSIHRQCIAGLGLHPAMAIVASAPDGVPEAIERVGVASQVGLQFHPEWQRLNPETPEFQGFFDSLVADAEAYRQQGP